MLQSLVRRHALTPLFQLRLVFYSTVTSASTSGATASPDPPFMVDYLVNSCGFSADGASKVSESLPLFRSTEKPDAVLGFLRSQGFDGANLRKIISWRPRVLGWDVEANLVPKFKFLRDMGLSESDVIDVLLRHPIIMALNLQNTLLPRLKAWESLFGSREILLNNLRKRNWFLSNKIEKVRLNLNFLRDECGIPEARISLVFKRHPCFIVQNPESLRALVDRAEEMGISRKSAMFLWILDVLQGVNREKFESQGKLMNSFGWSNSDFIAAIKTYPHFLCLSTEVLQRKMEFLVKDVGMAPLDVAKKSVFLALSLEKRLIPRLHVMEILKSEGLWTSQDTLRRFFLSPGPKFLQKYVLPYKDKLPKLLEIF
ncbi:transcription termination factor MTERF8, chloroplastic-like [Curcuma longa]|uniref:transcription termination factor MTERF8, chloroplastic-like n=1 Tax=Curcuma longa TaxID=136217 RepID=UPI003D9E2EAE